jgi:hypothetical protein
MPGPKLIRYKHRAQFQNPPVPMAADGAIDISFDGTVLVTKGSAAALTMAAPGAKNIGRRKTITSGTDFAHVVTFTGGTLWNGAGGAKTTWTAPAVQGATLTVEAISATKWNVVAFNLGAFA